MLIRKPESTTEAISLSHEDKLSFDFSSDEISSMEVISNGSLRLSLVGGKDLLIENFEELAEQNVTATFSNGESFDFQEIYSYLIDQFEPTLIQAPEQNTNAVIDLLPGQTYQLEFNPYNIDQATLRDDSLIIEFHNQSQQ